MWPRRRHDPSALRSKEALQDAQNTLEEIKGRHEEVTEIAKSLRKLRRDNHFSEHLTRIMMGGSR